MEKNPFTMKLYLLKISFENYCYDVYTCTSTKLVITMMSPQYGLFNIYTFVIVKA